MKRSMLLALGCLLGVVFSPTLHADTMTSVVVTTPAGIGSTSGGGCDQTGANISQCSASSFDPLGSAQVSGAASAAASYGILHSTSLAASSCGVGNPECFRLAVDATAISSFSDTFTITNAPANGELVLHLQVDGSNTIICNGLQESFVCGNSKANSQLLAPGADTDVGSSGGIFTESFAIAGSGKVPVSIELRTYAACLIGTSTVCDASSDYYDTATVISLAVFDSQGNPVNEAVITAASGTDYNNLTNSSPVVTPEPSTLALLGTGLAGIASAARRRPRT
jgi:hypothetical protein